VTVTCHPPFALARPAFPEMTRVAALPAPRIPGAVLMPLIVEDDFYEIVREFAIPDRSVSSVTQAGSWSARNSRSGFVPSRVLADFTDDPDRDMGPWIAAGTVKRAKGGMRIIAGHGLTVINAADVEAKTAKTRASNNERKQRSRERLRAGQAARIQGALPVTRDVTHESHSTSADVTGGKAGKRKKPQARAVEVTRDIGVTSRGTSDPSRAPARDFDFDFNQREENQVSQSGIVNARAREDDPPPGSPAFRLQVIAAFAEATPTRVEIDDATADALAAEVLGKATAPVPFPLGYVLKAIADERDPCGRWLPKRRPAPPSKPARPEWCGECGKEDRMLEVIEDGKLRLRRCPKCSGQAPAWEKNAS
jgi:hypothetical protein